MTRRAWSSTPPARLTASSATTELQAAGVRPGTVRLSVGTESVDDLTWDLEQGLKRVAALTPGASAE